MILKKEVYLAEDIKSSFFPIFAADAIISGKVGTTLVIDGKTVTIVGYTNAGRSFLISHNDQFFIYKIKKGVKNV